MKKIELDYHSVEIKKKNSIVCEMLDAEQAFLCGVLRYKKPKKIVEVGVAEGGTTCVILECLKEIGNPVEMHSVDISKVCHLDPGKKTGYEVERIFEEMPENIQHYWHFSGGLPSEIEAIGSDIDVLILDTMHSLPGEILDFLAAFPYLAPKAAVILHDIEIFHLYDVRKTQFCYATKLLYETVIAEKLIPNDVSIKKYFFNIGAFEINEDTKKCIENCFGILSMSWRYLPNNKLIQNYKNLYLKVYGQELAETFGCIAEMQQEDSIKRKVVKKMLNDLEKCTDDRERKLVLYGGGDYAVKLRDYIGKSGKEISAYVVSDHVELSNCQIRENIYHYSELPFEQENCNLIIAMSAENAKSIKKVLEKNKFHEIVYVESDL